MKEYLMHINETCSIQQIFACVHTQQTAGKISTDLKLFFGRLNKCDSNIQRQLLRGIPDLMLQYIPPNLLINFVCSLLLCRKFTEHFYKEAAACQHAHMINWKQ